MLNTELPLSVYDPGSLWCRVGTAAGWVSPWVKSNADQGTNSSPAANKILQFKWVATMSRNLLPGADCGWRNQGIDHSTDATTDISGTFVPTADSAEWRIYRRVGTPRERAAKHHTAHEGIVVLQSRRRGAF